MVLTAEGNSEMVQYTGEEALRHARKLTKTSHDTAHWVTEYIDPHSGERWVLDYLQSELNGGGPPRLRKLPPRLG